MDGATPEQFTRIKLDVGAVRADPVARLRVYKWIRRMAEWDVLQHVAPAVMVEAGKASRGELPADYLFRFPLQCRELLTSTGWLLRMVVGGKPEIPEPGEVPSSVERSILDELERWLEALRSVEQGNHSDLLQMFAGLSGGPVPVGTQKVPSGCEALWFVCCSLYNGMAGNHEQPFEWLGWTSKEKKPKRPLRGRARPSGPSGLERDDVGILAAVRDGTVGTKAMSAFIEASCKVKASEGHVRKRKADLVKWGLLEDIPRAYKLTEEGERWIDELRPATKPK